MNYPKPPWHYHECLGGIGDSGLSGWNAIEQLQALGVPITPEVIDKAFGRDKSAQPNNTPSNPDIERIAPEKGKIFDLIVNIIEFSKVTTQTEEAGNLTEMGRQMQGIPKEMKNEKFYQITFGHNDEGVQKSYTALVPQSNMPSQIDSHRKNRSVAYIQLRGLNDWWLVEEINIL